MSSAVARRTVRRSFDKPITVTNSPLSVLPTPPKTAELRKRLSLSSSPLASTKRMRLDDENGMRVIEEYCQIQSKSVEDEYGETSGSESVVEMTFDEKENEDHEDVEEMDEFDEEEDEYSEMEDDHVPSLDAIESRVPMREAFAQFLSELNRPETKLTEPPQMTNRCAGMGDANEVWNVMHRRGELLRVKEDFLRPHPQINEDIRATLIEWMQEVSDDKHLHRETFHLSVDFVDRFLSSGCEVITTDHFQLLGTTALVIASKYEEIYPPKVEEFVSYTADACDVDQVKRMECLMVAGLEWELNTMTHIHWIHMFLQLTVQPDMHDKHLSEQPCTVPIGKREEFHRMAQVLDLCLFFVACRRWSNHHLAAAVFFCFVDSPLAEQVTGSSRSDLRDAIDWVEPIVRFHEEHPAIGNPLPSHEEVAPYDVHNIQTHRDYDGAADCQQIMAEIRRYRRTYEEQKRADANLSLKAPSACHRIRVRPHPRPVPLQPHN